MPLPFPDTDPAAWYLACSLLAFVWGTCLGSFLNVCIFRIPRELSVVWPRSYCPACKNPIPWYLNIPLLSYPLLRGRCHSCHATFTPRYLVVEALTGVLFLLAWLKLDGPFGVVFGLVPIQDWKLVLVYWVLFGGLILGTFVDFEHLIIPDRVTLGGIVAGLVLSPLVPALHDATSPLLALIRSGIGAAVGWILVWGIGYVGTLVFRKDAMGFGDVKLMGAIGAFLGWQGVLFTITISSFVGSIAGVTLVLMRRREMQSRIPYGPYLALAAILWVLWGPHWWEAYLNLLAPPDLPPPGGW